MAMTNEARQEAVAKAVKAASAGDSTIRVRIPEFREGKGGPWPVIHIRVDKVAYNPRSHRVIAQLEGHPLEKVVETDPFCDDAQDAIKTILRATDRYERIRDEIKARGQKYFGIVTHAGMIVNANTRLAALRENGADYIEVAVLPEDADENDILELETALQVQDDFKQDYDFANQLRLIQSYIERRYDLARTAKALNEDESYVETHLRWLAMIREIQELHGQGRLPIVFFNDKKQAIREIDSKIEDAKKQGDPARAEEVREAGYLGLVLGLGYEPMRYLTNPDVVTDRWIPLLADEPTFGPTIADLMQPSSAPTDADPDDDSGLLGGFPTDGRPRLAELTTLIASNHGRTTVSAPGANGTTLTIPRDKLIDHLLETAEDAAEEEKLESRQEKKASSPVDRLKEARKKVQAAIKAYPVATKEPGFDQGKFDHAVATLKREVGKLEALKSGSEDKSAKKRK